jgi:CubicO group peptidase (beta-lactamase class C family)
MESMKAKHSFWILCLCLLPYILSTQYEDACFADALKLSANPPILPTDVDSNLDVLREYVKGFADREETPGIGMLVAQNGRVVIHEAYGFADPDFEKPFLKDTMVFLASSTKPLSATAIMILVDEG